LLPSDILGVSVFSQRDQEFLFHEDPVFTDILLADEINRSSDQFMFPVGPLDQLGIPEVVDDIPYVDDFGANVTCFNAPKTGDQLTARRETCSLRSLRAMPVLFGSRVGSSSTKNRY
jgi:hypothetical protein